MEKGRKQGIKINVIKSQIQKVIVKYIGYLIDNTILQYSDIEMC